MTTHKFQGRVFDRATSSGIPNARVEGFDVRNGASGVVCATATGAEGSFLLQLDDEYLDQLFGKSRPVLAFRVVDADNQILASTERTLRWVARGDGLGDILTDSTRVVGKLPGAATYTVDVLVVHPAQGPLASKNVRIYDVDLSASATTETAHGSALRTDAKGRVRFVYSPGVPGTHKPQPRLKVRAEEDGGALIAETFICRARPRERVTLVAGGGSYLGPSRHAATLARVTAVLGPATLANLTAAQKEVAACRANLPLDEVDAIASAAVMNAGINSVGVEAFYGLIRAGLPRNLGDLALHRLPQMRRALEQSILRNEVASTLTSQLDTIVAQLELGLVTELFRTRTDGVPIGIVAEGHPTLTDNQRRAFVKQAMKHEGDAESFWAAVALDPEVAPVVNKFRFTFEAAPLLCSHQPMHTLLAGRFDAGQLQNARALAKYTYTDWLADVTSVGFPPTTPGGNDTEKRANYAALIAAKVEARFRTRTIAWRTQQASSTDPMNLFFFDASLNENNPNFDFSTIRVDRYLAENSTALSLVPSQHHDAVKTRLRSMERLYRVTQSFAEMDRLTALNITSSSQIHEMGLTRFVAAVGPTISAQAAHQIYENACWTTASTKGLYAANSPKYHKLKAKAWPDLGTQIQNLPTKIADWGTLFGSLDTCSCEHCQSIYGPAAYLVDLLRFVAKQDLVIPAQGTAETKLLALRPDINILALSCENTDTPVPYIDLVNEILEVKTANELIDPNPGLPAGPIDTTREADELLGAPETPFLEQFTNAYRYFAGQLVGSNPAVQYPPASVFHLWAEEARVLLEHLGVPRHELLRTLQAASPPAEYPQWIAAERLALSRRAYRLITGLEGTPQHLWGTTSGAWVTELGGMPLFLRKARVTFDEAREILGGDPSTTGATINSDPADPCDTTKMTISGLTDIKFGLISRVLRLRKALGWTIHETEQAVFTLGAGALNADFVEKVARLEDVRARLGITALQGTALYADLSRRKRLLERSFFAQVFLSKTVADPDTAAFKEIDETGSATGSPELGAHKPALLAALNLTNDDYGLLAASDAGSIGAGNRLKLPYPVTSVALSLANLSRLYRLATFSQAMRLPVRDFIVLRAYSGLAVLAGDAGTAHPDQAVDFFTIVDTLQGLGVSVAELDFYLRDVATPASGLRPSDVEVAAWEADISGSVKQTLALAEVIEDEDGALCSKLLDVLFPAPSTFPALLLDIIKNGVTPPITTQLDPLLPYVRNLADTKVAINKNGGLSEVRDRYSHLARQLARYLDSFNLVIQWLAARFRVEEATAKHLVGTLVLRRTDGSSAIRAFLPDLDPPGGDPLEGSAAERQTLLRRIQKAAGIVRQLGLSTAECQRVFPGSGSAPVGGLPFLDLNALPTTEPLTLLGATESARFGKWLELARLVELRRSWKAGSEKLFDVFAAATTENLAEIQARIATGAEWPIADVVALCTHFNLTTPATDFDDEKGLLKLAKAMGPILRIGAPASEVVNWLDPSVAVPADLNPDTPADNPVAVARAIRRVARSRNGAANWSEVVRPLRDVMREKQRDALAEYLLYKKNKNVARDLFEDILVDVEMSPCQLTSRIVHATGTIQTFVQRALLRYYDDLKIDEAGANQWRWMKNYRVWEANRKIFLYPENWVEPDLRDDKSPLFEAFERQLRQGPVTLDRIEDAYRAYLEGLDELSSLDVRATCVDVKNSQAFSLHPSENRSYHVFARTRAPHRYYHRRFEDGGWRPWEKLDIDVEGDHLVPLVHQGVLYLFWMTLEGVTHPVEAAPEQDPNLNTKVSIRYAVRRHAGWSASEQIGAFELWCAPPAERLSFHAFTHTDGRIAFELLGTRFFGGQLVFGPDMDPLSQEPLNQWALMGPAAFHLATLLWDPLRPAETEFYGDGIYGLQHRSVPALDPIGNENRDVAVPFATAKVGQDFVRIPALVSDNPLKLRLGDEDGVPPHKQLLASVPKPFRLIVPRQQEPQYERQIVLLQDRYRTFVARLIENKKFEQTAPQVGLNNALYDFWLGPVTTHKRYRFERFDHPFVYEFRKALAIGGLDGLLRRQSQSTPKLQDRSTDLSSYGHDSSAVEAKLREEVDFAHGSPMGIYNWELFFHLPFTIAVALTREGRYEDALKWFHYVFDPMNGSVVNTPQGFWGFKPFRDNLDLADIQGQLTGSSQNAYVQQMNGWTDASLSSEVSDTFAAQIAIWRKNPFNPHAIARLRPVAYQKAVVMKYIDNLLSWADQLFARDTIESINEATQLYLLAWDILGPRPNVVATPPPAPKTWAQLKALDQFGNAFVVNAEAISKFKPYLSFDCANVHPPPLIGSPYFCTPPNQELLGKWDVIEDRLFKIRHCQNIEGLTRQLPLFAPPIDPALLVQAAAFGIDIQSVLNDVASGAPSFRFTVLHQRATEIASFVMSLGSQLLSALEKKDAEHLANLRAQQDVEVQDLIRDSKRLQIKAAKEELAAAERSRKIAEERRDFYEKAQGNSALEDSALLFSGLGQALQIVSQTIQGSASTAHAVPNFHIGISGTAGSPVEVTVTGGESAGNALGAVAAGLGAIGSAYQWGASTMATQAGYQRRDEEFKLQETLAKKEINQIDKQIAAARIRVAVAEADLALTDRQLAQARDTRRVLLAKFTKEDLYEWMVGEAAAVYYQAYKLAYDVARKAERAYQIERGDSSRTYVRFGYWDSLRKGLLAGEKLALDLRRLDAAYLESKSELELTKQVSLAKHDPEKLLELRETGKTTFKLVENDFDRDYPTHYLRRLKQVSVSMPCVSGPYEGVMGTLTLSAGKTRLSPTAALLATYATVQSICTSTAREDSGKFELQFREERLLPFEGVGAHVAAGDSDPWEFKLSRGNELDYDSISDLVLHLRYTARQGRADTYVNGAENRKRLFRLKHDFADAWQTYQETAEPATFSAVLTTQHFVKSRGEQLGNVASVDVYTRGVGAGETLTLGKTSVGSWPASTTSWSGGSTLLKWSPGVTPTPVAGTWTLSVTGGVKPTDVWLIFTYDV
jgi:hypothetical protein